MLLNFCNHKGDQYFNTINSEANASLLLQRQNSNSAHKLGSEILVRHGYSEIDD
jgi:hypothetical protein